MCICEMPTLVMGLEVGRGSVRKGLFAVNIPALLFEGVDQLSFTSY